MLTDGDMRIARLKAAINECREGNLSAMLNIEISRADLITIGALAKAAGDTFAHSLTQRLLGKVTDRNAS